MSDGDPAVTSKQWEAIARERLRLIRKLEAALGSAKAILLDLEGVPADGRETLDEPVRVCILCGCRLEEDPERQHLEDHLPKCERERARRWVKEHVA